MPHGGDGTKLCDMRRRSLQVTTHGRRSSSVGHTHGPRRVWGGDCRPTVCGEMSRPLATHGGMSLLAGRARGGAPGGPRAGLGARLPATCRKELMVGCTGREESLTGHARGEELTDRHRWELPWTAIGGEFASHRREMSRRATASLCVVRLTPPAGSKRAFIFTFVT